MRAWKKDHPPFLQGWRTRGSPFVFYCCMCLRDSLLYSPGWPRHLPIRRQVTIPASLETTKNSPPSTGNFLGTHLLAGQTIPSSSSSFTIIPKNNTRKPTRDPHYTRGRRLTTTNTTDHTGKKMNKKEQSVTRRSCPAPNILCMVYRYLHQLLISSPSSESISDQNEKRMSEARFSSHLQHSLISLLLYYISSLPGTSFEMKTYPTLTRKKKAQHLPAKKK